MEEVRIFYKLWFAVRNTFEKTKATQPRLNFLARSGLCWVRVGVRVGVRVRVRA